MRLLIIGGSSAVAGVVRRHLARFASIKTAGLFDSDDFHLDLCDPESIPTLEETFDAVLHCAASFAPDDLAGMLQNEAVNSLGALCAAGVAKEAGASHIVYLSSISVYDHPDNAYFGSYGLSKRHGQENLELFCRKTGVGFTALLAPQLYDDHGHTRPHQGFLYHLLDCAAAGEDITLYGSADPLRNLLHLDDLAAIIERVLREAPQGVFPCTNPHSHSVSQIAKTACEVFESKGQVRFDPRRPDIPAYYIPDAGEFFSRIGFTPQIELVTGFRRYRQVAETAETP